MFFNRSKDKKRSRREQANEKLKEQSRQKIDELYPSVEAFNKAAEDIKGRNDAIDRSVDKWLSS